MWHCSWMGGASQWRCADLSGVLPQLLLRLAHATDGLLQLILGLPAKLQAARCCLRWRHPEQGGKTTGSSETKTIINKKIQFEVQGGGSRAASEFFSTLPARPTHQLSVSKRRHDTPATTNHEPSHLTCKISCDPLFPACDVRPGHVTSARAGRQGAAHIYISCLWLINSEGAPRACIIHRVISIIVLFSVISVRIHNSSILA